MSHSEVTMFDKRRNNHLRKENMTPTQLAQAQARAAHAREKRLENAINKKNLKQSPKKKVSDKKEQIDLVVVFDQTIKAYETKIASLEHQAIQYRTVIDYLESKVDSLLSRK